MQLESVMVRATAPACWTLADAQIVRAGTERDVARLEALGARVLARGAWLPELASPYALLGFGACSPRRILIVLGGWRGAGRERDDGRCDGGLHRESA